MKKLILILLIIICFMGALPDLSYAAPLFDEIYKKALSVNSGMKDCEADLSIKIKAKWYLGFSFNMSGKYYFKAPDKFKVDLKRTPSFVKKYPKVFSWALPDVKDFNTKVKGEEVVDGKNCYVLYLMPKQLMGDLDSHTIWIDDKDFIMRRQTFKYNTGGEITINQYHKKLSGFWVFDTLSASFSFPKINLNATVNANYENYKFNQNLPDSLFE